MIDTSWCVDSKMTEDVVKDLLLFQGRKKGEIQLPSGLNGFILQTCYNILYTDQYVVEEWYEII